MFSEEATGDGCSCECCSGCIQILGSDFGNMPAHMLAEDKRLSMLRRGNW